MFARANARLFLATALLSGLVAACDASLFGGEPPDTEPPTVSITDPGEGETVNSLPLSVEGVASDDRGVVSASVRVDGSVGDPCSVTTSDADSAFACNVDELASGENIIVVTVRDDAGNEASASVTITYASTAVQITSPSGDLATTHGTRGFEGNVDPEGLVAVTYAVNGGPSQECHVTSSNFTCPVAFASGDNEVVVTATYVDRTERAARFVFYDDVPVSPGFDLQLVFYDEQYTPSQRDVFVRAAERWQEIITNDLENLSGVDRDANSSCFQGEPGFEGTIDDLLIFVTSFTQAEGGVLGSAGPCLSRDSSSADRDTNAVGFMQFDTEDVDGLEESGNMMSTILHEMGHVLGIGTNWELPFDLLEYTSSDGEPCDFAESFVDPPVYTGTEGVSAYHDLGGSGDVPVEDEEGLGTQCGHWDEERFHNELMTGFLNATVDNPLSELTARSLRDIGFEVEVSQADPYVLPPEPVIRAQAERIALREILLRPVGTISPTGTVDLHRTP